MSATDGGTEARLWWVFVVYLWCTVSTDYTRANVYVQSVYQPRTVSTDYTHTRIRTYLVKGGL